MAETAELNLASLAQTDVSVPLPKSLLYQALSSPPFITLPGTFNTRDLGLVPGSPIRPGKFFRSGGFFMTGPNLPEEAKSVLSEKLKIKKVFDLRSVREHEKSPDPADMGQGVEVVWTEPAELDATVDIKDFVEGEGEEGYKKMYLDVLRVYCDAIKKVLEYVRDMDVDEEQGGMVFHCTAGRDRTGVMAGILLTIAGAKEDVVALDLLLSRIGTEPAREQLLAFALKGSFAESMDAPGFHNLASLRASCWAAFIKAAEEEHGGLEGYVKRHLGFSEGEVERIRANLVGEVKNERVGNVEVL
ncbi:tyrosine-protein phosphatase [Podospora australis]|uniref:Tyrosine-protein phosphatase n=1 Tax=Podospora australis TaxID=1536484 RepID=A0AAN6WZ30_9PEZI|nr:tyrosine-protein phosphatase [Podospora australis]